MFLLMTKSSTYNVIFNISTLTSKHKYFESTHSAWSYGWVKEFLFYHIIPLGSISNNEIFLQYTNKSTILLASTPTTQFVLLTNYDFLHQLQQLSLSSILITNFEKHNAIVQIISIPRLWILDVPKIIMFFYYESTIDHITIWKKFLYIIPLQSM